MDKEQDITTELKLRIKFLEKKLKEKEEQELEDLREFDKTIGTLMVDIASYKEKMKRIKKEIRNLYDDERITRDEYMNAMEYIND